MIDHDMTLNDLVYLLGAAESTMIWRTDKANLIRRSTSQTYLDIDNGDIRSPEKLSLPNGNRLAMVKSFDPVIKRKDKPEIVSCAIPKKYVLPRERALVAKLPYLPERLQGW